MTAPTTPPVPPPAAPEYPEYPPLVDPADPDWASFQAQDIDYFLSVAGEVIRRYCGWRIYPNLTDTVDKLRIGTGGRIMLPSLYVTDVASVTLRTGSDESQNGSSEVVLTPDQYEWFEEGYVLPYGWQWWGTSLPAYYYGPDTPAYMPWMNFGWATVVVSHGYPICPPDVKLVAYELAEIAHEFGVANVKDVSTPGFKLSLTQNLGMNMNPQQIDRLSPYKLTWTA
jgi:hypothetical protein